MFCSKYILNLNILLHMWLIASLTFNVSYSVKATNDIVNITPNEMKLLLSQLINPSRQYQMHAAVLRQQLKNLLRHRLLTEGEEQYLPNGSGDKYQVYREKDKRSLGALAGQDLLNHNNAVKRSLATLAKNGQLPTPDPNMMPDDEKAHGGGGSGSEQKRYVGALARSGNMVNYGKRNIGTLARDYLLPHNGKRNVATMTRLGFIGNGDVYGINSNVKRNLASVARYNSQRYNNDNDNDNIGIKRNLAALRASSIHSGGSNVGGSSIGDVGSSIGNYYQQKRATISPIHIVDDDVNIGDDEVYMPAVYSYVDPFAQYWDYGTYADLDWNDFHRAQKRFLDASKDPELYTIVNANGDDALYEATYNNDNAYIDINDDDEGETETERETETDAIKEMENYGNNNDDVYNNNSILKLMPEKRHIGAVYRSGFLPSYRSLRSFVGFNGKNGVGGDSGSGRSAGRFSRSGRARQFVDYYPQHERQQHQRIAAVCKRCFIPFRLNNQHNNINNWQTYNVRNGGGGRSPSSIARQQREEYVRSIATNHLPSLSSNTLRHPAAVRALAANSWNTPLQPMVRHRPILRKHDPIDILRRTLYNPPIPSPSLSASASAGTTTFDSDNDADSASEEQQLKQQQQQAQLYN